MRIKTLERQFLPTLFTGLYSLILFFMIIERRKRIARQLDAWAKQGAIPHPLLVLLAFVCFLH